MILHLLGKHEAVLAPVSYPSSRRRRERKRLLLKVPNIAKVQTAYYYGAKWRPVYTSQGLFMYDNGRRLLANRLFCTFIGRNDVLGHADFLYTAVIER